MTESSEPLAQVLTLMANATEEQMEYFLSVMRFGWPLVQAGEDADTIMAKWREREQC